MDIKQIEQQIKIREEQIFFNEMSSSGAYKKNAQLRAEIKELETLKNENNNTNRRF